jgi:hypothetical protein
MRDTLKGMLPHTPMAAYSGQVHFHEPECASVH